MLIRRNQASIDEVQRASFRDTPPEVMKSLYIAQNTYDLDLDQPLYRVLAEEFLFDDITQSRLTHTRISRKNWSDDLENPLFDVEFTDSATGGTLTMNGVVEDMFGVCWTDDSSDSELAWNNFSHGRPSVRIKSTPRKLMAAAMNQENPFYMLHHFIGKVEYKDAETIRSSFSGQEGFEKHLDSLGQGVVTSLMQLRTAVSVEQEARLVYNYMRDEPWVQQHVEIFEDFCRIPFDWNGVIDEVVVGPLVSDGGKARLETKLRELNINCSIIDSIHRSCVG